MAGKHRKHTPIDLAYTAGLVDGEGFIIANSYCPRKSRKFKQYNLRVGIVNTNREVLLWVKSLFGGGVYSHGKANLKHKQAYVWNMDAKKAEVFLKAIYPCLKIKKLQAEVALRFRRTFDTSKYDYHHVDGRITHFEVPEDILLQRLDLRRQLRALNIRGSTDAREP